MVNYKKLLDKIKLEKKELQKQRSSIPSQLNESIKKQERKDINEKIKSLSTESKEIKSKEKAYKKNKKKLDKFLKKKVVSRKIIVSQRPTLTIKPIQRTSVLGDPNRFFNSEMEETKRSLFFQ